MKEVEVVEAVAKAIYNIQPQRYDVSKEPTEWRVLSDFWQNQYRAQSAAAIEAYHKAKAGEPRPEGTPPLAALHDREAMEAARQIKVVTEGMEGKRLPISFQDEESAIVIQTLLNNAQIVARALLQGHDREAVIESCAKVADELANHPHSTITVTARQIAKKIRALSRKEKQSG